MSMVLQALWAEDESRRAAWPDGYFERTFGSLSDDPIAYEPPPDFEVRSGTNWE
jgi:hypothetical protein